MDTPRRRPEDDSTRTLVLCLILSVVISLGFLLMLSQQEATDIERMRTIYSERTESFVNTVFHKTDVLASVVQISNGDISEETFDKIAKIVYVENSGIRGVQYMPGAVVTYSYPLEGNEAVMGKNFLEIPERAADCQLAIDTKSIALSGPNYLIQGGLGLVARNPIFLTDASGNEYFWGFSAIVLDLPDALESVGLDNLPDSGYDFQLYCVNENGERIVIAGDEGLDDSNAVAGAIQVPNHEWTLLVRAREPWRKYAEAGVVLLFGILLSIAVWRQRKSLVSERAATRAKDAFFSDVSHDMRTPLNAVIGFSRLARAPDVTDDQRRDYLEKVERSGNLLVSLINDTLTISKAGNGKIELHPVPQSARGLFVSVIDSVEKMADDKGVSLSVDVDVSPDDVVMADVLSVQKVLLNLLSNAVRYTPSGGHVWYAVSCEEAAVADRTYSISVRDDGIGMSRDFQKRIFEPFSQERRPGYESVGTGLGLSIVKQLVDLMGGSIAVESDLGEGTEFRLSLSLPRATGGREQLDTHRIAEELDLSGKKFLICEDNALNAEIACALVKERRADVSLAKDGREGVRLFSEAAPGSIDAVLMDVRMPVMDGLAAARAIRSLDRPDAASVPIVAMTANTFSDDVQACFDAGMDAHVAKPIDPDTFYVTLFGLLGKKDARG